MSTLSAVAPLLDSAGITYRRLDHWTRRGYLRDPRDRHTSGVIRDWPESELEVARCMARLVDGGLNVAVAAGVARKVVGGEREIVLATGIVIAVAP